MIFGINFSLMLGVILPPILYATIIYLTSPYKSIVINRGLKHIIGGMLSVTLLGFISILLPNWDSSSVDFFNTFFYIAPREELVKLLVFLMLGTVVKRKTDHPVATMFYMAMIGLGFALVENLQYVSIYGEGVLPIRAVTATVAHMLFGMFMGYWIAKGNINNGLGNRSVFSVMMSLNPRLKQWVFVVIGWLSAIGYHGLWNYNLMLSNSAYGVDYDDVSSSPIMIMMLIFGLVGSMFASKDLNDNYRRNLENKG